MHNDTTRPRQRRLPRWFRRFVLVWVCLMLTLMALGYAHYIFTGRWTPEHMADWFRLGLGGI